MISAPALAITEQRNPRSRGLDQRSVADLVDLFIREESYVNRALKTAQPEITKVCTLISQRLQKGGRLFYLGAGTSGRLGVLDASEMPPTFNVPPSLVQGLIAGGETAIRRSVEGAEDDTEAAAQELSLYRLTSKDIVVGITANGHAPYVLAGLQFARTRKTTTVLLTCNPARKPCRAALHAIDLRTGPELITGSTRLKAGTATKLVLNMFTSIAMIRSGRVRDNLMIQVQPTNAKLKERAVRLVMTLTHCTAEEARHRLEKNRWSVASASKISKISKKSKLVTGST
jgi:N-acetylmuramic acid 6-phosphate etherase